MTVKLKCKIMHQIPSITCHNADAQMYTKGNSSELREHPIYMQLFSVAHLTIWFL